MMKHVTASMLMCLIAICIGLVGNTFLFEHTFVAVGLLTLIAGLTGLLVLLAIPSTRINFFLVSSPTVLLGSSVGILNSYYLIALYGGRSFENLLFEANITESDIVEGMIYVNLFCISLSFLGYALQNSGVVNAVAIRLGLYLEESTGVDIVILLMTLIQIYLFYAGVVTYGGGKFNSQERNHPLSSIAPLFALVPVWCGYVVKNRSLKQAFKIRNIFLVIAFLVSMSYFFVNGRRMIFFFFFLSLVGVFYNQVIDTKLLKKRLLLIVFFMFLATQMANLFNQLRMVRGYTYVQEVGLIDTIGSLEEKDDSFRKDNMSNVTTRTAYSSLTIAQFVSMLDKMDKHLHGLILKNSFLAVTPSDIFVNKYDVLLQEALYMREYGIHIDDISDSVYLEAIIDFGYLGFILYPLVYFAIIFMFYNYAARQRNIFSFILAPALCLVAFSMIESGFLLILSLFRIVVFVFFILKLIEFVKGKNIYKFRTDLV